MLAPLTLCVTKLVVRNLNILVANYWLVVYSSDRGEPLSPAHFLLHLSFDHGGEKSDPSSWLLNLE